MLKAENIPKYFHINVYFYQLSDTNIYTIIVAITPIILVYKLFVLYLLSNHLPKYAHLLLSLTFVLLGYYILCIYLDFLFH